MLYSATSWLNELVLQRNVLVVCNLWTSPNPSNHGQMPSCITCITATVSIWVLIAVQLSFSSISHWYFSLLFYFFLHLCPSDGFDHKSIKYWLWTKVHWTFLAAHWFFVFQAVRLPLFNNSFARGIFFFALGTWFTQPEFSLLDFRFADPSPYESFLHECA